MQIKLVVLKQIQIVGDFNVLDYQMNKGVELFIFLRAVI
jgi:hypothetical protein